MVAVKLLFLACAPYAFLSRRAALDTALSVVESKRDACSDSYARPLGSNECECPDDRPHIMENGEITRRAYLWKNEQIAPALGARLRFFSNESTSPKFCVDECLANSVGRTPSRGRPLLSSLFRSWPVVFLVVYTLGFGAVHSNLAFCPQRVEAIVHHAQKGLPNSTLHTSLFAEGQVVPQFLMRYGCRELIWDGNENGNTWSPNKFEAGCWSSGRTPTEVFIDRSPTRYQRLYWLTSSNEIRPFLTNAFDRSVEAEMRRCFSSVLHNRLDFNPGTYNVLHHNCNKFTSEAMKFMGLPLFAKPNEKGHHDAIAFSASHEQSYWRRFFSWTATFIENERSVSSKYCVERFWKRNPNCRRVGDSSEGDCPGTGSDVKMNCYDPESDGQYATDGLAPSVTAMDSPNGICARPLGSFCFPESHAQCQPGSKCKDNKCVSCFLPKRGRVCM